MAGNSHFGKSKSQHEQRKRSRQLEKLQRRLEHTLDQGERIRIQNDIARLQRQQVAF